MRELNQIKEKQKMLEYHSGFENIFFPYTLIDRGLFFLLILTRINTVMLNKNGPKIHSYETVHA